MTKQSRHTKLGRRAAKEAARDDETLTSLKNIGPAMERGLAAAGITSVGQLREIGAVEAYLRMRAANPKAAHKMVLYALWGALNNENCLWLAPEVKEMLGWMVEEAEI